MAIYTTFKQARMLGHREQAQPLFALCRKLRINASRAAYAQLPLFRAAA
jgi:hypothetical protein